MDQGRNGDGDTGDGRDVVETGERRGTIWLLALPPPSNAPQATEGLGSETTVTFFVSLGVR